VTVLTRSLPIAYELVGACEKSRRLESISITAKAPFCWGRFGFDAVAERTKSELSKIPTARLRRVAAREFARRFNSDTAKNPERSANIYLRGITQRVSQIINQVPLNIGELNCSKRREAKADELASMCERMDVVNLDGITLFEAEQMLLTIFDEMSEFAQRMGVEAPAISTRRNLSKLRGEERESALDKLERAVLRMTNNKWWRRKLNRLRDITLEHLNITMGLVNKQISAYASKDCIAEFKNSKRQQAEWLESMQIENEDGLELDLKEVFKGTVANPEIRRIELMVRVRGCQEWADENGLIAMFYTITAPSRFHAKSKKYNNASPRDTQKYLTNQWAKVRATLKKTGIQVFGLRVAEPHADATPHWHLLLFMRPEEQANITEVMQHFALQHDANEAGAKANRFKAELIDRTRGDAVGYIAKYISKNINANHVEGEKDYETGENFAQENGFVSAVGAWASRWRIRQFQFVGGAPVGVWREFRRINDEQVEKLDDSAKAIREAADNSRFSAFIELMGGAFAKRDERPACIAKEKTGVNEYGEAVFKVSGIKMFAGQLIEYVTRAMQWRMKKRGSASPWSTENNCNHAHDWQAKQGEKLTPLHFVPVELRPLVERGASYIEHEVNQITEHRVKNGILLSQTYFIGADCV